MENTDQPKIYIPKGIYEFSIIDGKNILTPKIITIPAETDPKKLPNSQN